ncbi:hypothetical protein [Paenibacillus naphthalenovorans]|uniref:hypothetical protein n=1 Tax=Paenibacillus naphthalenovorans TaxID=162209 RepID=UPI003D26F37B
MIDLNENMLSSVERLWRHGDVLHGAVRNLRTAPFAEYAELRDLAKEMRSYGVAEFDRLAFRIERLLTEIIETERAYRDYQAESRQVRKQLDLLARSYENLTRAYDALMDNAIVEGVRLGGLRFGGTASH